MVMTLGTKRADLCVIYGEHKYPVELKLLQNIRNHADSLNVFSMNHNQRAYLP